MAYDAGFVFDFGVCLPSPASGAAFFFFTDFCPLVDSEPEKRFDFVPKGRFENIFDFDDFMRLFRVEIQLSHGGFRAEITAAYAAWHRVFRRANRMAATATHVAIFPSAVTEMLFFHL